MAKGNLQEGLKTSPQLLERIEALLERTEALLNVLKNTAKENELADLAKERIREEALLIGEKALSSWAISQQKKQLELLRFNHSQARKYLKKN